MSHKTVSIRINDDKSEKLKKMSEWFFASGIISRPTVSALIKEWVIGRKYSQALEIAVKKEQAGEKDKEDYLLAKEQGII